MTWRKNEPVPVWPLRIRRVVLKEPVPKHVGHGRGPHGGAWMAGVGILNSIHRQKSDGIDAKLIQVGVGHYQLLMLPEFIRESLDRL